MRHLPSDLPFRRLQQAFFEGFASSNRTAGSGGGSGFRGIASIAASTGFVGGIVSTGWTVIATTTLNLSHPTDVMLWGNMVFNRTAGVAVDTFSGEIQKDSDADWVPATGIIDGGTISAGCPNDTISRTFFLVKIYAGLNGSHTLNLKGTTNGDTFQAQGSITIMALG